MRLSPLMLSLSFLALAKPNGCAQQSFSAEGPPTHSVAVPPDLLKLWTAIPDVQQTLRAEGKTTVPQDWYRAESIRVADNRTPAVLFVGQAPLAGAHAGWFWLYVNKSDTWVLRAYMVADQITVLATSHAGLHDIKSCYFTASNVSCAIYTFNGRIYRATRHRTERTGG